MSNKIAMITDLHFGIRKNSDEFLQSQLRFMQQQFIPELRRRGIKILVFGGDLFDSRISINTKIGNAVLDLFKNDLADFDCYLLAGNHDIYYNNTVKVNSIKHLGLLSNVTIIDEITPMDFFGTKFLLVPWQTSDANFAKYLNTSVDKYDVCLCHYAIHGFLLNKLKVNTEEGIPADVFFANFKLVISGHFHSRNYQTRGDSKILYMGCPWHLSRADINEEKGGLVLDVPTLTYEFIDNTKSLRFVSVKYPDKVSKEYIEGNIVDIHVEYTKDYNDDDIHAYIQSIEEFGPIFPPNIKIINDFAGVDMSNSKIKNTTELIQDYVQALDVENKDEIFNMILELYDEARGDI